MIVFVTGASAGFGAAIARTFVKGGHRVIAAARRKEPLVALQNELGDAILPLELDVRDEHAVRNAIASLPEAFAPIDVLVNNAGLARGLEPAHQASLDDWDTMIATNCVGLATCTRAVLPGMVQRGRGHVVNLGSIAGTYPYPGGNVYGATKAFVEQFSLNLRCDLQGTGVRVSNLEPGLCESEFSLVRFGGDQARYDKTYAGAEALQPEDIAETIYWIMTQPPHININSLELMPASQAWAGFSVHRKG
jgi:3-hydroxy acid dehydrogenase/malonic semialdehyde reductase